jgi:hypothetical protein
MPVALPLLCSGRERRPRLAVMPLERLAPIPRCAECEAAWLPADEERWQAWLTDDEPPYPSSTARSALSGSAATEELGWTDLRRSRQGGPNHSRDPAPTQRSLAGAHGGPRPVAAARLGSGRNRRADPRKRIRLEAQAQALGPELTPHVGVETVDKFDCGAAGAHLGSQAARSGDFMTLLARSGITQTGDARRIPRKEREFLRASKRLSSPRRSKGADVRVRR